MSRRPLVLTLWPGTRFPRGRRQEITWREFLALLVERPEAARKKEDCAGFALASFVGNRRSRGNVEQVFALGLDLDDGMTVRQAARVFPGVGGVIYTTFRHTPALPKLRLLVRLSRPVTGDEYGILWGVAAARCARMKHAVDPATCDPSRLWFVPAVPIFGPNHYAWRELKGRALDVERVLRGAARLRPLPGAGQAGSMSKGRPRQEVGESARGPTSPAADSFFGRAFVLAGWAHDPETGEAFEPTERGALPVVCPWEREHTGGIDGDTSTVVLPPTSEAKWGLFKCSHAHCAARTTLDLLDALPAAALAAARHEHGAGLVRARVARGHVQHLDPQPGFPALDRLALWLVPVGGGTGFTWTVKLGSRAHDALDGLGVEALRGRRVDVAIRGREITWGRLVPTEKEQQS